VADGYRTIVCMFVYLPPAISNLRATLRQTIASGLGMVVAAFADAWAVSVTLVALLAGTFPRVFALGARQRGWISPPLLRSRTPSL